MSDRSIGQVRDPAYTNGIPGTLGIHSLQELARLDEHELTMSGVGIKGVVRTVETLRELTTLPAGRLEKFSWADARAEATLPRLPLEVLRALCYAHTVDAEITALLADLGSRDLAVLTARWGVEGEPRTLEEIGRSLNITRERARQIVQRKELQIRDSGLRLPLAAALVDELEYAGGALPTDDYALLARHGVVPASIPALKRLPLLAELGCVPGILFDAESKLWLTSAGRTRWIESAAASNLVKHARRIGGKHLRRMGSIPHALLDSLSPFGREHSLELLGGDGGSFRHVGDHAIRVPARPSALLRQCLKTLAITGPLQVDELAGALERNGFAGLTGSLLSGVLAASPSFEKQGDSVVLSARVDGMPALSAAEQAGFELLDADGGAMLWLDFVDGMAARGFSAPMAHVVLRKPAVLRHGPAIYGLRGREVSPETMQHLRRKRRRSLSRAVIASVRESDGAVVVDYVVDRFALQGVLPAPGRLKGSGRVWTARFQGGHVRPVKIANHFVWPLRWWFREMQLRPGDGVRAEYRYDECQATFEVVGAPAVPPHRPKTREEQILRALFESDG